MYSKCIFLNGAFNNLYLRFKCCMTWPEQHQNPRGGSVRKLQDPITDEPFLQHFFISGLFPLTSQMPVSNACCITCMHYMPIMSDFSC